MDKPFMNLLGKAAYVYRKMGARGPLNRIVAEGSEFQQRVAKRMMSSLYGRAANASEPEFQKLEGIRSRLSLDTTEVTVIDYGAGDPDDQRSEEEMKQGNEVHLTRAQVCTASKPEFWARFLHELVREFEPKTCLELGTCVGISACYQGLALRKNGGGTLYTLEGAPQVAELAQETIDSMDLAQHVQIRTGPFHDTFLPVLEEIAPVDYLFIDGHHDYKATLDYFHASKPYVAEDAILVFDDISWSPGMRKAWDEIVADEAVASAMDLRNIGLLQLGQAGRGRRSVRVVL